MKAQIWIITVSVLIFSALGHATAGQEEENNDQVPKAVIEAFERAYPNANTEAVEFEKEMIGDRTVYEVEFEENDRDHEILFDADGVILRREETIDVKLLPEPIIKAITSSYPQVFIKEAEMLRGPDGTITGYEVEIRTAGKKLELELDAHGRILEAEED